MLSLNRHFVSGLAFILVLALSPVGAETLKWARSSDATTLDPHLADNAVGINLLHQLYEPLILRHPDGRLIPALATAWRQDSTDARNWEFDLRADVTFHNGEKLTRADVIFSLERARTSSSYLNSILSRMRSVKPAGNDKTIVIQTTNPDPVFPNKLADVFIMNASWAAAHHIEHADKKLMGNGSNYAAINENGTGPYRILSREPDQKTVLTSYPGYWGASSAPQDIDRIEFLPIKNAATRVAALLSGEIDFVQDVSSQDVERLQRNANIRVNSGVENRIVFLGFNTGAKFLKSSNIKDRNPFSDYRVRQAVGLALDRDLIKKTLMRGLSRPAGILALPQWFGYAPALDVYPRQANLNAARALLKSAGYEQGFKVTLDCPNDRLLNDEALCNSLANALSRIGIKAVPRARPFAIYFPALNAGESDLYLASNGNPIYDSTFFLERLVHTKVVGATGLGAVNTAGFSDPSIDQKIAGLATLNRLELRAAALRSIWKSVDELAVYIPLHQQILSYAMNRRFDIKVAPTAFTLFKFEKTQGKGH